MQIQITWTTNDVLEVAKEHNVTLNESQANDVLWLVEWRHNPNIGINRNVIYSAIKSYLSSSHIKA